MQGICYFHRHPPVLLYPVETLFPLLYTFGMYHLRRKFLYSVERSPQLPADVGKKG